MSDDAMFKTCPGCFHAWQTRQEFLADPSIELNGYKADFSDLEYGMFFFTHKSAPCCSTMTLMVEDFRSLYSGPTYPDNKALSEECPRYCLDDQQLSRCDALCECAFAREISQIIADMRQDD